MIRSERTWRFDLPRDQLWEAIAQTDQYRRWWPWLRRFEALGFVEGDVWSCTVQPPLPYWLRFSVTLERVEDRALVEASVAGDIRGAATLLVADDADGSTIRLTSDLEPSAPVLQAFALAARPMVVWGHDWVLDRGVSQFRRRALPR